MTRVWSTGDPCPGVEWLLRNCDGDCDEAIRRLVAAPCSYTAVRQMADALAHCMDMTPAQFIKRVDALGSLPLPR
jgi:hypothetical protein